MTRASAWDFLESGIDPRNPRINDIKRFTREPSWMVDVGWSDLLKFVKRAQEEDGLDLDPDFQRGHVWTEQQQIAFVEFCLRGGRTGRDLYFNSPGWPAEAKRGEYVIVDGKQRLTAVCRFLEGHIRAFGYRIQEFRDTSRMRIHLGFKWHINSLMTRAEVLTWYLEFNSAGTPHTEAELARVRGLLEECKVA